MVALPDQRFYGYIHAGVRYTPAWRIFVIPIGAIPLLWPIVTAINVRQF